MEIETLQRKTKRPGEEPGTTGVATTTASPWWLLSTGFFLFHFNYSSSFSLSHGTSCAILMLSHFWTILTIFFDPLGLKKSSNLVIWACKLEFCKNAQTNKTAHNRRNRGINRITIHFNPLK